MDCITVTPCCLETQFFPDDWPFAAARAEPRALNSEI